MMKSGLIIVCVVFIIFSPLVNAESVESDQNVFENATMMFTIKDCTYNYSSEMQSLGLDLLSTDEERFQIPRTIKKYEFVTLDQPRINTDLRSAPPHLSFQIDGLEYPADLQRMDFESLGDGIDSYSGTLAGEANSSVLLTVSDNATIGSITLNNEIYYIEPVQSKTPTNIDEKIPHIIYRSKDMENTEFLIDKGPITSTDIEPSAGYESRTQNPGTETFQPMDTVTDGRTAITVLIVTDNQFYSDNHGYGWKLIAQDIIAEANRQFGREDIGVILIPVYDDSRRQILSNQFDITTNPLNASYTVFPNASLDSYSADLCLYLGGYDFLNGEEVDTAQGAAFGYDRSPHGRHSWAQMVPDYLPSPGSYFATIKGRRAISIHEIGHSFDAGHQDAVDSPYYNRAFTWGGSPPLDLKTVMWSDYSETATTCEFSSLSHMGNEMHDNARRIKETKNTVAGYSGCSASVPSADFRWDPNPSNQYQLVTFSLISWPNDPPYYYWDLGDGSYSYEDTPPHHTYNWPGEYTVSLTTGNCAGSTVTSHNITINSASGYLTYSGTPRSGIAPLRVQFNSDGSTPTPTEYNWSFGDGKFNESANPEHTYDRSGRYSVTLNATQGGILNTRKMPDFIDVSPQPPHADFTNITPTTGDKAPFTVTFTDTSTNDPDAWSWTFGDGSSSTSQNPTHAYAANGTFTVTLVATNRSTGSKGITKTNYISVGLQYVETYGPYTVLKFNNTGTTTWMPPQGVTQVDYLVVAGGGEGGNGGTIGSEDYPGGGGGGGGVKNGSTPVAGLQTIIVGQGGSGTAGSIPQGAQGGNSVFGTITAFGGGAGAGNCFSNCSAGAGGSGGGGSGMGSAGGNGTEGQGYAGGAGNYTLPGNPAGGGGGAGAAGATPGLSPIGVNRGDGGNGRPIDITGTATYYGGGGGGGIGFGDAYGLGGAGCGGDGSRETANNAKCQATGGGGGGAGGGNLSHGSGGSGVVIIRYPTSSPLRANFTAIPRAGPAPLAVQFTDASTGGPASWNWDFGDGDPTNATDQNPVHTYLTNGSFTVNLTVSTDGSPSNKTIKVRFINVGMQDKIGVFRPSTHIFYQDYNGNGAWNGATIDRSYSFGISGDTPMTGDWNNDGTTEIGVFRNSTHLFYQDYNGDGAWSGSLTDRSFNFGATGDTPITGDWNNDGITEIGIYRNSTNQFYQDYNGNGVWNGALIDRVFSFGISGDTPITGDWNNDGITEIGVFRNSTAMYYQDYNGNGAWNGGTIDRSYVFGMAGDLPVAGRW